MLPEKPLNPAAPVLKSGAARDKVSDTPVRPGSALQRSGKPVQSLPDGLRLCPGL